MLKLNTATANTAKEESTSTKIIISESNDFNLMSLDDKAETVYKDAVNATAEDEDAGSLSIYLDKGSEAREKYCSLLRSIRFSSPEELPDDELIKKSLELAQLCVNEGFKLYQIIASLLKSDRVKKLKWEILKEMIKNIIKIEIPPTAPTETVVNGAVNNVIVPTAQLNESTGIDANSIINNINTSEYTELDNAVKWLTDNVKFGCKIDGAGEKVSQQEAINLYKLFSWPEAVAVYNKYCPVKDGNKRLWFRLENHELLKNNNIYKYVFGAISGSFPGKRIIFACNPDTMLWTAYLE